MKKATKKPAAKATKPKAQPKPAANETVQQIDPKLVIVSKLNTRQPTRESVAELAASIKAGGQITPAIVRPAKTPGKYELAAGARRKVACQTLGIPLLAIVRDIADDEFEDMILTDNLQREDPDPMQEALLIERRITAGASPSEIAARYGKSETWLKRRMKLIGLTKKAREAMAPECAFGHFTIDMMEFIGTLPAAQQDHLAEDPWDTREFATLKDLIEAHRRQNKSLKDAEWLNDPASFVENCGPGCATNDAQSLFPDPDNPCGNCLNADCFNKRRQLFLDSRLRSVIGDQPVTAFVLFASTGYARELVYEGRKLPVLPDWEFKEAFTKLKKAKGNSIPGIDMADPTNPVVCHLAIKETATGKGKGAGASPTPGKPESREDKLTGKRLAAINGQLVAHLETAPIPPIVPILSIVAAFGVNFSKSSCFVEREHKMPWTILDEPGDTIKYEHLHKTASSTREECLWLGVLPILKSRLSFQINRDLLAAWKQNEMRRIASLTGFDYEGAWQTICTTTVPVPKSWGPGIDPITLKPAKKKCAA